LLHHLLNISRSTDTEITPTSALRRQKIVLIWVVRKAVHEQWIGKMALTEVENKGVQIIIPLATEDAGHPDLHSMVRGIADGLGRGTGDEGKKIGVVVSGPDGMNRLVRNTCTELVRDGQNVDIAVEKFGW